MANAIKIFFVTLSPLFPIVDPRSRTIGSLRFFTNSAASFASFWGD